MDITPKLDPSRVHIGGRWAAYVPQFIALDVNAHPSGSPIGREQRLEAAALIADISGFTSLSEAFGPWGPGGAEELARVINLYFTRMTTIAYRHGGDIAKFGGDSLVVIFPALNEPLGATAARSIAAANEMQGAMSEFQTLRTSAGTFGLSIKIGVGVAPILCTVVGDPSVRLEYVIAGRALDRAAAAQDAAHPGEILIDRVFARWIKELRVLEERGAFFSIGRLREPPDPLPEKLKQVSTSQADRTLATFLHPVISRRVKAGQSELVNEHRRSTILFVGFEGVDYEDASSSTRLQEYFSTVLKIVEKYEGHLSQIEMGDKGNKYIVLFGSPIAHEDDVERALDCSLELVSCSELPTFMGIATGLVFCGHVGSELRREYAIVGDTANLAARLMQVAEQNQILVSLETRTEAGRGYEWSGQMELELKGKRDSARVSRLVGRKQAQLSQLGPGQTTLFVGRHEEIELASDIINQASQSHGHVLGISGEAGIGKSRLAKEIAQRATAIGFQIHGGASQAHDRATSYLVWRGVWRSIFQIDDRLPAARAVEGLQRRLASANEQLVPRIPLLAPLLGLVIPDNSVTRSMDFEARRDSLKQLLLECLRMLAREGPCLILLEDCHWIDFLSNDLLAFIGRNIDFLPVLIVFTYRSTGELTLPPPELQSAHHFTELPLAELDVADSNELVMDRLRVEMDPGDSMNTMAQRISGMGEGNPFYIEELVNFFLSKKDADGSDELIGLEVPDSLRSLVMTRIDQLAESEKTTLKVASVIGRTFRASWIWGSYPDAGTPTRVGQYLRRLDRLDLTLLHRTEPDLEYTFKHAITQEVAYESLSVDARRSLHEAIGRHLEESYGEEIRPWVSTLAYHYSHTKNNAKKRVYFRAAAAAARETYDNDTAIDLYSRLAPLVDEGERVHILTLLGELMELVGHWDEAEQLYRESVALAQRTTNELAEAEATCRLGNLTYQTQGSPAALPLLRQALATFKRLDNVSGTSRTLHHLSQAHLDLGDRQRALQFAMRQMELAEERDDPIEAAAAFENMGLANWESAPDSAVEYFRKELAVADSVNYVQGVIHACNNIAGLYVEQGNNVMAIEFLQRALEAATRIGYQHPAGVIVGNAGLIYRNGGDFARAFECLATSMRMTLELGDKRGTCNKLGEIAVLRSVEGHYEEAGELYDKAIELSFLLDIPLYSAEFLYHKAYLRRRQGLLADALDSASKSLEVGERLDHPRLRFRTETLITILRIESGKINREHGREILLTSLATASDDDERAGVHYELWKLTGAVEHRDVATRLFQKLFSASGNAAYGSLLEELTGVEPPSTSPLPGLSEEMTHSEIDFERLLIQVDNLLRATRRERAA